MMSVLARCSVRGSRIAYERGSTNQSGALQRMATAPGWQIVRIYAVEGYSSRKTSHRTFDEILLAVRRGEADVLAVRH